jgi:murein DD-endopeptidase MepM/ murein hydrolase activator NlpD
MKLIIGNPTGGKLRADGWGHGAFGAPRSGRKHLGLDLTLPNGIGQPVRAPIAGIVSRYHDAYGDGEYRGISISQGMYRARMLYVLPYLEIGAEVEKGQRVGEAQDISLRYPPHDRYGIMIPHVHFDLWIDGVRVDPALYLEVAA